MRFPRTHYLSNSDEVALAKAAWHESECELDDAIEIEMREDVLPVGADKLNIRRFRRLLLTERAARVRYARALVASGDRLPRGLLWDLPEVDLT